MEDTLITIPGKVNELSAYFSRQDSCSDGQPFALLSGQAGIVLLQAMLYQGTKDEAYASLIMDSVERITGIIDTTEKPLPTFCGGLAGFGWLLMYLNKHNIIDMDADQYLDELDRILEIDLYRLVRYKNFDILHGAMGIGLYFIKRNKPDNVKLIINALAADKHQMEPGFAWSRIDYYTTKERIYDFGLAHGNAGMLYFLGKSYEAGIMQEQCKALIDGCVQFFMNNIQPGTIGSFYPNMVNAQQFREQKTETRQLSRLAWCYGDLGILHTVLLIAHWTDDKALHEKVVSMLLTVAARRSTKETMVRDAGFCHGAIGNCYVFKNIYRLTGQAAFLDAANYWMQQTLNLSSSDPVSVCGYLFHKGEAGWGPDSSILSGLGGIGLVLADHAYTIGGHWNECYFLS